MKNLRFILIIILLIVAFVVGIIWRTKNEAVKFNETYVNGNSAGNLFNAGLFCEKDGVVYFANPDDNYKLYQMDSNGSNVKLLADESAEYINADSNYVYYVRNNASGDSKYEFFTFHKNCLCRYDLKTGKIVVLDTDPCMYPSLLGNYIYYMHYDSGSATTLYKIKIDGSERKKVSNTFAFPCSALGRYFYYNDEEVDGSIYQYDTQTDTKVMVYQCNSYKPTVTGQSNCFYLDVDQDNALMHIDLSNPNPTLITSDSIDIYNVYGSHIFYQKYDPEGGNALCVIKSDGTGYQEIMRGNYKCINVTSYYVYFTDYTSGNVFYTPTSNPGELHEFHPGSANKK